MKLPSILKPKGLYTSAAKGKKSMGLMLVASVVAVGTLVAAVAIAAVGAAAGPT